MYDKIRLDLLDEARLQGTANNLISRYSNIGASNPNKGPTAKSLFYEAGKRVPGKYGNFLFYALGSNENSFIDAYYRSEASEYNVRTSSIKSKNPTASYLVTETVRLQAKTDENTGALKGLISNFPGEIVGGESAPYYWKDFLYCKHYGTIPNNYMVTLRRFPTPVLDNMSIPTAIKDSDKFNSEGAGRPVAQAVTWFGRNTGNSLNELISFGTGIEWKSKSQDLEKTQEAMSKGFFQDGLVGQLGQLLGRTTETGSGALDTLEAVANAAVIATDPSETTTNASIAAKLRDRAKDDNGGVMSEYIWTSVDVVKNTYVRDVGLKFDWKDIKVVFEYELTSVGEVNTKAALLDILGNLLSIGTNYGTFLSPDVRYNSNFAAVGFPGGNAGLELYYSDPLAWLVRYASEITNILSTVMKEDDLKTSKTNDKSRWEQYKSDLEQISKDGSKSDSEKAEWLRDLAGSKEFRRLFRANQTNDFIANYQMPVSFLTGAPIGEWHLVIGNPCNPVAMIGNLICSDLNIEFTDLLGPDDFPTGIKATFTLQHARDRDRGEIESIFNRGDGRLYHSAAETASNQQSFGSVADVAGNVLSYTSAGSLKSGFWRSQLGSVGDQSQPNNP
jgi:hypothetical protein